MTFASLLDRTDDEKIFDPFPMGGLDAMVFEVVFGLLVALSFSLSKVQ